MNGVAQGQFCQCKDTKIGDAVILLTNSLGTHLWEYNVVEVLKHTDKKICVIAEDCLGNSRHLYFNKENFCFIFEGNLREAKDYFR